MIGIKKRFQVAKCKTSLKLATARIKLMRNKKGAQVIQMKKELAQLLASGDDRTARIRVEHVIREEKMIGAYDLIEIYCELIVARLPIIESQKTCPMDLKEAIASVIFASPRCSDITELVDVKKNFRAKYGKEFVTAATELIPDCGVSRMLVEKLSAVAPNIQTKVKVLSDIAKEHNVDWEATSFEEVKPRDDLPVAPISVDPPKVQTAPDIPADFFQLNKKFTSDAAQKNVTPADTSSSQQSSYGSTGHNDARPTNMASGSMKKNQPLRSNSNNEDMEFKDATSAAHAAAEAAERASYAARAAAKLAREGSFTQKNPTKSHESHNGSFNNRNSRNESTSSPKVTKSSSGGSRSRNDSDEDRGPSKKVSEARFKRGDSRYDETDYDDDDQRYSSPEISSRQKFNSRAEVTSNTKKGGRKTVVEQETVVKNTKKTGSFSGASRHDESESDDDYDGPRFDDTGFDHEDAAKIFFPSPDKEEEEDSHVWSPIKNKSNSKDRVKPAKSVDYSVKSHLSDGPDSGSESGSYKFDSPRKQDFSKKPVEESQSPVRPSRMEKKKPSVRKASSESDYSDDNDDKFPQKPSRSPFARPNTYFSNGNDSDEEVYTPTSKAHLSPHGVSRRTKDKTELKPKQEPPKRVPEPKVSTPPADVKKPSHVHPKLPDFEDLAERIYAINKMERK